MIDLKEHIIPEYKTLSGVSYKNFKVTYQIFGKPLHEAPIVLVHHALTGNSDVLSADKGWWKEIVGNNKLIDTKHYTVIAFDMPGNGYNGYLIENYKDFCFKDMVNIFIISLKAMGVKKIFASIGGSIGGFVPWQIAISEPDFVDYIIPVASHWQTNDWLLAYCYVQDQLLEHSSRPLFDARVMGMIMYRTTESLNEKFKRTKADSGMYNIASWLQHHGDKLESRYDLHAYKSMNNLLFSINPAEGSSFAEVAKKIKAKVIQLTIDSDIMFDRKETLKTKKILDSLNIENEYHEIISKHGHDGFLIENEQICKFLEPIFGVDN